MNKITVIVPIYNALEDVKKCLKSLKNNFNFNLGEVILINDFSDSETSIFLHQFINQNTKFKLLENEENLGFVKTCNKGLREGKGNILVLLNSDTIIPKTFAEKIIKCFNSDNKIGIASPISSFTCKYFIPLPKYYDIEKMNTLLRKRHVCTYPVITVAEGFCFCIRREVIKKQGFLDEIWGKGYYEEVDFGLRAITNGWINVLIDDLYVYHKREASFGAKRKNELLVQNNIEFKRRWGNFRKEYRRNNNLINPVKKIEKEMFPKGNPARAKIQLSPLEQIFSIRNTKNKKRKIITILGIKCKFKNNKKFYIKKFHNKLNNFKNSEEEKPKILLISHELSITGAPLSLMAICNILKNNYNIEIWSLKDGELKETYIKNGFNVSIVSDTDKIYFDQISNYDFVIANTILTYNFAKFCEEQNIPYIWYIREAMNIENYCKKLPLLSDTIKICNKNIYSVSKYAQNFINSEYSVKVKVLNNFIPDTGFIPKKKNNNLLAFTFLGTAIKRKGLKYLLKAFPDNAILNICSEIRDDNYGKELIELSKDKKNIIWQGIVLDEEKKKIFAQTDVFVVPSIDESCSRVVIEAMMAGRPVIVTQNVGGKYMVNKNTGWIVKTASVKSLRKCIENIINNPVLLENMGHYTRKMYLKTSTEDIYKEKLFKILNKKMSPTLMKKIKNFLNKKL